MEQVWFLFLYGWVPAALVVLWEAARCLRTDWRGEWKFLAWMLGLLAADLILWLVGEPVLAAFGLAWRSWLVFFFRERPWCWRWSGRCWWASPSSAGMRRIP